MIRIIRKLLEALKSTKPSDPDRLLVMCAMAQFTLDLYTTTAR